MGLPGSFLRIGSLLVALLVQAACAAQPGDTPSEVPQPTGAEVRAPGIESGLPDLTYLRTEDKLQGYYSDAAYPRSMDVIRLVNQTRDAFEYTGDNPTWPLYSRQFRTDRGWVDEISFVVCATLLRPNEIAPGACIEFPVHAVQGGQFLTLEGLVPADMTRVGLRVTNLTTGQVSDIWTEEYPSKNQPGGV